MGNSDFSTFPSNSAEALTMLYLQNQDLSNCTPEELVEKYQDTYNKIREHYKAVRKAKRSTTDWTI